MKNYYNKTESKVEVFEKISNNIGKGSKKSKFKDYFVLFMFGFGFLTLMFIIIGIELLQN